MIAMGNDRLRNQAKCRAIVFRRDRGVCAVCGLNTELILRELEAMQEAMEPDEFVTFRAAYLEARGLPIANKSLWIADHYPVPHSLGGPDTASNLRTLCTRPCCQAEGAPLKMLAKTARLSQSRPLKPIARR